MAIGDYDAYAMGTFQQWEALQNQIVALNTLGRPLTTAEQAQLTDLTAQRDVLKETVDRDPTARFDIKEAMRQGDIKVGRTKIDSAFTQFGDSYYDNFKNDYTGYYYPQIDQQYGRTRSKIAAKLFDRGLAQSTVAGAAQGDLLERFNREKTNIGNQAVDASNELRGNVQRTKGDLFALNESAADPQTAGASAVASATALAAPSSYSPLGDVFASALQPWMYYQQARQNAAPAGGAYTSPYGNRGQGSGTVVR